MAREGASKGRGNPAVCKFERGLDNINVRQWVCIGPSQAHSRQTRETTPNPAHRGADQVAKDRGIVKHRVLLNAQPVAVATPGARRPPDRVERGLAAGELRKPHVVGKLWIQGGRCGVVVCVCVVVCVWGRGWRCMQASKRHPQMLDNMVNTKIISHAMKAVTHPAMLRKTVHAALPSTAAAAPRHTSQVAAQRHPPA